MTLNSSQDQPPEASEYSTSLFLAEYESVRAESVASFANSQSILTWALGTYGVLFGAGIVASSQPTMEAYQDLLGYAAIIIYAFLLPGFICVAAWQWLGEITRMERTGVYMRGIERAVRDAVNAGTFSAMPGTRYPLGWETFLFGSAKSRKRNFPYVGTAGMFFGALASSYTFGFLWMTVVYRTDTHSTWLWWLIAIIPVSAAFFAVSGYAGYQVIQLGKLYYDPQTRELKSRELIQKRKRWPSAWKPAS